MNPEQYHFKSQALLAINLILLMSFLIYLGIKLPNNFASGFIVGAGFSWAAYTTKHLDNSKKLK